MKSLRLTMPLLALLFVCCKQEEKREEPVLGNTTSITHLTDLKNTEFFASPDNTLTGKNAIYCASLPYAWTKIGEAIGEEITVSDSFPQLQRLNEHSFFVKNVFTNIDYKTTTHINELTGSIEVSASFSKQLPFEYPMDNYNGDFVFNGTKVEAFCIRGGEYEFRADILEYNSDSDFIVRLNPKDPKHEILIWMPSKRPQTLEAAIQHVVYTLNKPSTAEEIEKEVLKTKFSELDFLVIPKIDFDIDYDYPELINNTFTTQSGKKPHTVAEVYQHTKFRLDEKGAEVQSEAAIAVDSIVPAKPKRMFVNKPFLLLLRSDTMNPYLAVWVENTELLVKNK
ncbi:serpin family protein [Flavobacterium beibuense]|nr:serpin family protein [Flavobacterium beibuense]